MDSGSLLGAVREVLQKKNDADRDRIIMARHIRVALSSKSGTVLREWLRTACYMDGPMTNLEIESTAQNQRINARRDLFIALENLEKEGARHVADSSK